MVNERDRKRRGQQPETEVIYRRRTQPGAHIGDAREAAVKLDDVERPQRPER